MMIDNMHENGEWLQSREKNEAKETEGKMELRRSTSIKKSVITVFVFFSFARKRSVGEI